MCGAGRRGLWGGQRAAGRGAAVLGCPQRVGARSGGCPRSRGGRLGHRLLAGSGGGIVEGGGRAGPARTLGAVVAQIAQTRYLVLRLPVPENYR